VTQGKNFIEYAQEFSKRERLTRIALALLIGLLIMITHYKWVFPFIAWYAETVHCHNPLGYSGISVLWHSLFVGLPMFCSVLIGFVSIPLGINGLRHKQFPPKGTKVYRKTKILRGWQANTKSIFHLLIPLFLAFVSVWGYFQVDDMPHKPTESFDYNLCIIK